MDGRTDLSLPSKKATCNAALFSEVAVKRRLDDDLERVCRAEALWSSGHPTSVPIPAASWTLELGRNTGSQGLSQKLKGSSGTPTGPESALQGILISDPSKHVVKQVLSFALTASSGISPGDTFSWTLHPQPLAASSYNQARETVWLLPSRLSGLA